MGAENCEQEHREMRRDATETRIALATVSLNLKSIQDLLAAVTNILQENLVTISAHDKSSTDWRGILLTTLENVGSRIEQLERGLDETNRLHDGWGEMHGSIEKGLSDISRNGKLLRGIVGLDPLPNPLPLSRTIQELLELVRGMNDLDREGHPKGASDWWWRQFREALAHGIVYAVIALGYHILSPYLPWVKAARVITVETVPDKPVTPRGQRPGVSPGVGEQER